MLNTLWQPIIDTDVTFRRKFETDNELLILFGNLLD